MSFRRRSARFDHSVNFNDNMKRPRGNNPYASTMQGENNSPQFQKRDMDNMHPQKFYELVQQQFQQSVNNKNSDFPKELSQNNGKTKSIIPSQQNPMEVESQPEADGKTPAATKADNQMGVDGSEKKKWKREKIPMSVRRNRMNKRLSKMLAPKTAINLLSELKPGFLFKVEQQTGLTNKSFFVARVESSGEVLGLGNGLSKSEAKSTAAEQAVKNIILKIMKEKSSPMKQENTNEPMEGIENNDEGTAGNLPWTGVAAYAIHKLFSEWQTQGDDVLGLKTNKPVTQEEPKSTIIKKELPPNASTLHPTVLLNNMILGATAVEIERSSGPPPRVTMGYSINGNMYTGAGFNKKDARKEAAKAAITALFGLKYS